MAVEIYLEPELSEMVGSPEVTAEWKQLAEELGMEGQLKLIAPRSEGGSDKNPSPYIHMNKKMQNVFAILCPEVIDYKKYDKTTIPREVLKEIALAEKEKYFDAIKIWYDDAGPDPVVVGYIKTGSYEWVKHAIARFGDEILPFQELEIKARKRLTDMLTEKLANMTQSISTTVSEFINPKTYSSDSISLSIEILTYRHRRGD